MTHNVYAGSYGLVEMTHIVFCRVAFVPPKYMCRNTTQTTPFHIHPFVYVLCSFSTSKQKSIIPIFIIFIHIFILESIQHTLSSVGLVANYSKIKIHISFSLFTLIHSFSFSFPLSVYFVFVRYSTLT